MERNCWYCHKPLPLTKLLTKDLFCSAAHEEQYFDEQNAAAFARMKEPEPPVRVAAKPAKPAVVEQVPALVAAPPPPPMAPLIQLLPSEALPSVVDSQQDPIATVGTPAPPRGNWTRVDPELAMNGWIHEDSAIPPPLAGIEGGFAELLFESNVALPAEASAIEPVAISSPIAPCLRLWTIRAEDQAMDGLSPAPSIEAKRSPRAPGVENYPLAHLRSNSADRDTLLAPIARSAPLKFASPTPHTEVSPRIPNVDVHPPARLRWSEDGGTLLAPAARSAPLKFVSSPAFRDHRQLPQPGAGTPNPLGLAACDVLSQGLFARRKGVENRTTLAADFKPRELHWSKGGVPGLEAPRVSSSGLRGGWDRSRPADSNWMPIFKASWTSKHNPAIAIRSTLDADAWRHGARRPANAPAQEIMARANGWSVILSPAAVDERTPEGTRRMPGAQSEIAAPLPVEAGANTRPSLTARDCPVISMTPNTPAAPVRAADFQAFSFTPVPQLAFAGATGVRGTIADSSLPRFVQAGPSEPVPATRIAKPRAFQPGAPVLNPASRVDRPWQGGRDSACEGPAPALDREGGVAFRIPETAAARPADPAIRAQPGPVSSPFHLDDAAAKSKVPTAPAVQSDPASMLASRTGSEIGGGAARIGGSPAQFRFFAMRKLVAAPFHGVLRAAATPAFSNSIGPAKTPGGWKLLPVTRGAGRAPLFALDVPLQQVAYEGDRRVAQKVHL